MYNRYVAFGVYDTPTPTLSREDLSLNYLVQSPAIESQQLDSIETAANMAALSEYADSFSNHVNTLADMRDEIDAGGQLKQVSIMQS